MPDDFKDTGSGYQGGRRVPGYTGRMAGKKLPSSEEQAKQKYQTTWLSQKGWAGIGGAAKRPADWESQFEAAWRKKQATANGQKKALAPTPAPSPTPKE